MQKQERRSAAITLAVMIFVLLLAVGLMVELLRIYVPDIWAALSSGNDGALEACLENQSRRLSGECGSDCLHDGIQLLLGEIRQKMLSLFRLSGQIPCLLPGSQILVKFHIFSP